MVCTPLFCVLECGDYMPRFAFENVNQAMIASPNNRLTMICESHPLRICFDGLSGDERSYEIARIHFINVKAIHHVVNHAKSLFTVNTGITTVSLVRVD